MMQKNRLIDKNEIGSVIIDLDVESKRPRYANFMM